MPCGQTASEVLLQGSRLAPAFKRRDIHELTTSDTDDGAEPVP
jgi:hypothetical protein